MLTFLFTYSILLSNATVEYFSSWPSASLSGDEEAVEEARNDAGDGV